jgi:hypothetical protein
VIRDLVKVSRARNECLRLNDQWKDDLIENTHLTSKEIHILLAYWKYIGRSSKRQDGSFYYSCLGVAECMGAKRVEGQRQTKQEQSIHSVHKALVERGYIISERKPRPQGGYFYYDRVTEAFVYYPLSIDLGSVTGEWGGKRVHIHHECGGECNLRVVYDCTRCGEVGIPESGVYHVDLDEYERRMQWAEEESQKEDLPSMEELDKDYAFMEAADIPDDIYDELGPKVLKMPPRELGQLLKKPRYEREGLCQEDLDLLDLTMQDWYKKEKTSEN